MTEHAVNSYVDAGALPPPGTAIMRPMRHVRAVRERHAQELAERSVGPEWRSARAWSWALGETDVAPVTDRVTAVPPSRFDIEAEIAVADERRLRGDRENRADGAATVLRWLIGEDDRVPVRGPNRGELVGGYGDVVRSSAEIAEMLAASMARNVAVQQDEFDYLNGVIATLRWLAHQDAAPISRLLMTQVTLRDLKAERVQAEDVIDQQMHEGTGDHLPPRRYGVGVVSAINWLLGDSVRLDLAAG